MAAKIKKTATPCESCDRENGVRETTCGDCGQEFIMLTHAELKIATHPITATIITVLSALGKKKGAA